MFPPPYFQDQVVPFQECSKALLECIPHAQLYVLEGKWYIDLPLLPPTQLTYPPPPYLSFHVLEGRISTLLSLTPFLLPSPPLPLPPSPPPPPYLRRLYVHQGYGHEITIAEGGEECSARIGQVTAAFLLEGAVTGDLLPFF
jgi:hypothetical protein